MPSLSKSEARHLILEAANRNRLHPRPLTMKDIQRAVAIVRHYELVDRDVIEQAGFRAPIVR